MMIRLVFATNLAIRMLGLEHQVTQTSERLTTRINIISIAPLVQLNKPNLNAIPVAFQQFPCYYGFTAIQMLV